MPIDPCLDGCLNHNIGALTLPVPGDDPCDSAGNGAYCAGSFWSYDAAAAGGAFGDCDRIFLRTGSDCLADQWLELCLKDQDKHIVINSPTDFAFTGIPQGNISGFTQLLNNTVVPVQNDSCLDMDICIRAHIWGTVLNFETHPGYIMTHDISLTVDFGTGPEFINVISSQNRIPNPPGTDEAHSNNYGEREICFVLPANTTQNVTFNATYNCVDGPCMASEYFGYTYTIEGHTQ